MEQIRIQIKRLRPSDRASALPAYMTDGAAGMDLCADIAADMTLAPMARMLIPTGIAIALPIGLRSANPAAQRFGVKAGHDPGQ